TGRILITSINPLTRQQCKQSPSPSSAPPSSPNPRHLPLLFVPASPNPFPLFGPPSNPSPTTTLSESLIPSAAAAAALALAALLCRPLKPALAAAPISQSETLPESLTDDEKVRALEDHLASDPDDIKALRSLLELKVKANLLPDAIAIIDRLIALEPDDKDLPLLMAHLHSHAGDPEAANQLFEDILSKNPFLVEAYHGLVMVAYEYESGAELEVVLKRVERAIEMCKKEGRKDDLRDFRLLVAQIRVVEGKYDDALKVYERMVAEEPRDFRPYLCQGIIYSMLKKNDEAEKQFSKYRKLVPREHPYAQYFDDNMVAMKVFMQMEENKTRGVLKR
ncbi:protein SLOW GREEN 1, chloroplastic-like, partial [Dioscorea cayenensis subsp. rotundata]|uniref:Protein SLOW GREEN 1, chloroplastic-like n=1 Tax=Dioscorea cayennensis subsp. rotundata TaxID=55577 RepID=A0AB40CAT3_DIOCR